jgi:hypothetical protein
VYYQRFPLRTSALTCDTPLFWFNTCSSFSYVEFVSSFLGNLYCLTAYRCVGYCTVACMYFIRHYPVGEPGSSVSIVSGYGLDDRVIEVWSPAEAEDFSSNLCVQTGSGAHPASCTMGTGFLSPGVKRGQGVTLTTHPHLVPRSIMSRSYTSSPPCVSMACSGTALILIFLQSCWSLTIFL